MTERFFSYPEGETFFVRSSLKTADWNPSLNHNFYGYALIELVYNRVIWEGNAPVTSPHPRSKIMTHARSGGTTFQLFDSVHIFYGPSPTNLKRAHKIHSSNSYDHYRAYKENDDSKAGLLPFPLPKLSEEYLWIDNTAPIRAIYFPLLKEANVEFPHVASYLKVAFNMRTTAPTKMVRNPGQPSRQVAQYKQDLTHGWKYLENTCNTLRIKYQDLYLLLSLQPRDRNPAKPIYHTGEMITTMDSGILRPLQELYTTKGYMTPGNYMKDFRVLVTENTGISMLPPPLLDPPKSVIVAIFQALASVALGLIPYIGPLLAIAWDLGMEAIDAASTGAAFPADPIDLAASILGGMLSSGKDIHEFMKPKKKPTRAITNETTTKRNPHDLLYAATCWVEQCQEFAELHPEKETRSRAQITPMPLAGPDESDADASNPPPSESVEPAPAKSTS